jgi:uncharacterized protein (TIGR02145 family)
MKVRIPVYTIFLAALLSLNSCTKNDNTTDPVTDAEGNSYKTVKIGEQLWMAENLKTSTFSDGSEITNTPDAGSWSELTEPGLCWYNNDSASNKDTYGALYNFYSVISGKLCPDGWHIPSKDEWQQLRDALGDTLTAGGMLKEAGTLHWNMPNTGAENSTGFTALPAGIRYFEGSFSSLSSFTSFWSSTEADNSKGWYLSLFFSDAVAAMNKISKKDGFSVRCLKD